MEGRGDHRRLEVGLVTCIGTHRHIGAYFHADRILDFKLYSIRPNASNFSLFSHISAVVGCHMMLPS